jgi:hypothetical protein
VIELASIPPAALLSALLGTVALLTLALTLAGRRYWWLGPVLGAVMIGVEEFRGGVLERTNAQISVIASIAILSFAVGVAALLPVLRAAYRENPNREFGQLLTEKQQLRFTLVVSASALVLICASIGLLKGFLFK